MSGILHRSLSCVLVTLCLCGGLAAQDGPDSSPSPRAMPQGKVPSRFAGVGFESAPALRPNWEALAGKGIVAGEIVEREPRPLDEEELEALLERQMHIGARKLGRSLEKTEQHLIGEQREYSVREKRLVDEEGEDPTFVVLGWIGILAGAGGALFWYWNRRY